MTKKRSRRVVVTTPKCKGEQRGFSVLQDCFLMMDDAWWFYFGCKRQQRLLQVAFFQMLYI